MTKQVQRRRGTATQHTSFTGAEGEISVNTTNKSIHVHDGVTAGGIEGARADMTNVSDGDLNSRLAGNTLSSLTITSADINGGTIDGTVIGGSTPAAGSFTTGSFTGDVSFGDNDKAIFGAGSDLQIYHDGSHSRIVESGTGQLKIQGTELQLYNADATKLQFQALDSGEVSVYYNNSKKLATTSTGIDVTGDATFADNGKAIFGAGSDLQIYHTGSHSYIDEAGTGNLYLNSNGSGTIITGAAETQAQFFTGGAVNLFYANAAKLATTSTGIDVTGTVTADGLTVNSGSLSSNISIRNSGTSFLNIYADTNGVTILDVDSGNTGGAPRFQIDVGETQAFRITEGNDITFYDTSGNASFVYDESAGSTFNEQGADRDFRVESDSNDHMLFVDAANNRVSIGESTDAPNATLEVKGGVTMTAGWDRTIEVAGDSGSGFPVIVWNSQDAGYGGIGYDRTAAASPMKFWVDATSSDIIATGRNVFELGKAGGATVVNNDGNDIDFRVESDTNPHALYVDAGNGNVGINTSATGSTLAELTVGKAGDFPVLKISRTDASYTSGVLALGDGNGTAVNVAVWRGNQNDYSAGGNYLNLHGYQGVSIASANAEAGSGTMGVFVSPSATVINEDSADYDFRVESDGNTHMLFVDAGLNLVGFNAFTAASASGASFLVYAGGMKLDIGHNGSAANGDQYVAFRRNSTTLGSITQVSSTGVAYNTTSDQRLKENIADADDAGSKIDAIQVRKFDWKIDGSHQDYGMVAQELQAVAPEAVSAPEDLDEMMSVDYSKLVPMLVKEIQSLRARVADLES